MTTYTFAQLNALYQTANGLPNSAHTQTMAAIAMAESSGNPNAHNPSGASGLWQIMPSHTSDSGWTFGTNFYDPATNARMAEFVYKEQGYKAWTTYTGGQYAQYLSTASDTSGATTVASNALFGINVNPFSSLTDALNKMRELFDPGFWRRVGIGILGLWLINIGIIILLRKPLMAAGQDIAKGAAVAAMA
jgi:Transglycosylase SLT domain